MFFSYLTHALQGCLVILIIYIIFICIHYYPLLNDTKRFGQNRVLLEEIRALNDDKTSNSQSLLYSCVINKLI